MQIPEIDVDELARRRDEGPITLIDVREPDEYEAVHVPGAILIPLATLPDRLDEIPTAGVVHLICRTGGRSMRAAEWLGAEGRAAVNVAGGTLAWLESGRPHVTGSAPS